MSKNTIKKPEVENVKKKKWKINLSIPTPNDNNKGSLIDIILNGTFLTRKGALRLLPLLFFLTFLAIFYIANNYWAIKNFREISKLKKELKELRFEHITTKSDFMYISKQSEVAKKLDSLGIKESVVPPQKLIIKRTKE